MRTQLTRSITLFDSPDHQPATAEVSSAPGNRKRNLQRWTKALVFGTSFAVALCAPLLRHLH
ncbi:hypothetical protein BGI51_16500 [Pseudomonas oryzihabitans]|uniref:hypothetical protein n=1 Tax=Pseudomonas oryzihabitans TaxID=47885 RepID=UPI00165E507A|nr:hypothetical protein [Pseudomonas psychrotolerans]QNQ99143.1 hypothetical protein BGI51_16500 [Pseudomonas psychrotolerans]